MVSVEIIKQFDLFKDYLKDIVSKDQIDKKKENMCKCIHQK